MNPENSSSNTANKIAIIGLAGRFPGAPTVADFWRNVRAGRESITFFADEELLAQGVDPAWLQDPHYVKANGVLADIELFDAAFFGISPGEARLTDPQQRLFMECAWEALEVAGYDPETYAGKIGVYAGCDMSAYLYENLLTHPALRQAADTTQMWLVNDKDHLPTRVSYKLNLRGPSVNLNTACSTSLVATHFAYQSLLNYECDMALAGGVRITVPQQQGYFYHAGGIASPDGHCRAFDEQAQGTVGGSGLGIVVLKRLADALADGDHIYAVLLGSAINNDGALKLSYTAPSVEGQAEVIAQAHSLSEVDPDTITYVETHGTGTPLGDPVEVTALTRAFRLGTARTNFCGLGSVKTNIGHLDAAAGVASLIKAVLALQHGELPPSLHFERPNPKIAFADSPFYVNNTLRPWPATAHPRRAGVSAFGIGGTNAHVVLEEAPPTAKSGASRPWQLLVLSAKSAPALAAATLNLRNHLQQNPALNLADVAYTLQVGRSAFNQRRIVVCRDVADAAQALAQPEAQRVQTHAQERKDRPVVFMFPGQGGQLIHAGRELYQTESVFRAEVDRCAALLQPWLGGDVRKWLYPGGLSPEPVEGSKPTLPERLSEAEPEGQLDQQWSQPALFTLEYALAQLWRAWGVQPHAMLGHSQGEYVAACLAGVLTLEDALRLVATRGRLIQQLPPGLMLAVPLTEAELQPWLNAEIALAAINAPARCVVSGPPAAIEALNAQLAARNILGVRLPIPRAAHSGMLDPILTAFLAEVRQVRLQVPQMPYISGLTGQWAQAEEVTDPHYWVKHLRHTVQFAAGVQTLAATPGQLFLEVGPGHTLTALAKRAAVQAGGVASASLPQTPSSGPAGAGPAPDPAHSEQAQLLEALGQLWLHGKRVDWAALYPTEQRQRVPLPTYPFERKRYWIDPNRAATATTASAPSFTDEPDAAIAAPEAGARTELPQDELTQRLLQLWQNALGVDTLRVTDNFFALGGDSLMALNLVAQLKRSFGLALPLQSFIEAPTVAQLTQLIEQHTDHTWSPLVQLTAGTQSPPFYCAHPMGGGVFVYSTLAQELRLTQPFYGIQARGLNVGETALDSIEAMAQVYVAALTALQPQGPYFLSGFSMGAHIAFEMARQLQARGAEIALLALMDAPAPSFYHDLNAVETTHLSFLATLTNSQLSKLQLEYDHLQQLPPAEQQAYLFHALKRANLLEADMQAADFAQLYQVSYHHSVALCSYAPPPAAYRGPVLLINAAEPIGAIFSVVGVNTPPAAAPADEHSKWGWEPLVAGPILTEVVPGTHYTMLDMPQVAQLANRLRPHVLQALAALQHQNGK